MADTPLNQDKSRGSSPANARRTNGKRKRLLLQLAMVFLLAGAGYAIYWALVGRFHESTDDAYVAGNVISVVPQIASTVTAIEADETNLVRQGQPLVKLDDTDTAIALDQAKANLAETVRQVRQMSANLERLRANVRLRQADLAKAKEDFARREALIKRRAVSREELQHTRTAYEAAQAALRAAQHELAAQEAIVGGTSVKDHPLVQAAEAKLREAYVNWTRHVVLAPVNGYVARRSVQIGQRVTPGTPLMSIVPLDELWVEANFKEDQFGGIRIGQPVTITADLYGSSVVFHGHVLGVSAGTGAAFALLPPQNASGNWIKIVQRVPVRISLDPKELAERPLRLGLSLKVSVDTHDRSGDILARRPAAATVYSTPVYNGQKNNDVDALIRRIIFDNGGPERTAGP